MQQRLMCTASVSSTLSRHVWLLCCSTYTCDNMTHAHQSRQIVHHAELSRMDQAALIARQRCDAPDAEHAIRLANVLGESCRATREALGSFECAASGASSSAGAGAASVSVAMEEHAFPSYSASPAAKLHDLRASQLVGKHVSSNILSQQKWLRMICMTLRKHGRLPAF